MAAIKLPATARAHTGDRLLDDAQRLGQQAARKLNALPFADGVLVRNQVITTGGTVVTHGLGRKPTGYIFTRFQGNASPIVEALATSQPTDLTKQIKFLAGSASVTADIFFF